VVHLAREPRALGEDDLEALAEPSQPEAVDAPAEGRREKKKERVEEPRLPEMRAKPQRERRPLGAEDAVLVAGDDVKDVVPRLKDAVALTVPHPLRRAE